ncbi:glycosyltransferase family 2 protein [Terricaulis silvestris]|uniref:glycosyltransferase family 2 protein n=1 Tax=Terricaulis silvestris TaxID=2686094 RepID=UPI00131D147A|nr:glycosyltransferase family A protein [Terricaulis silvestris]
MQRTPFLSVIVVLYDMVRESERSLFSLSTAYQSQVGAEDYEVIVVENGSRQPVSRERAESFGPNFRYLDISRDVALPSPCTAINAGVAMARAPFVGIMIDGARIASPGVLMLAIQALKGFNRAVVATIGLHLGPAMQTRAAETGYNQQVEDALLASVPWRENGYKLFEVSVLTGVNTAAWFGPMAESNLIFLSRAMYEEAGGFDPRFDIPGGGIANLDFYNCVGGLPGATLISLFGEATFHQIHGGVMSSRPAETIADEVQRYMAQYHGIHGKAFQFSQQIPLLLGQFRPEVAACIKAAEPRWNAESSPP